VDEIRVFSKHFQFDTIRYIFTAFGFPPGGSCPYTYTQKTRTISYIRRKSTDPSKQIVYNNEIKNNSNKLNALKHNKGRMTWNIQFKDKYANNGSTYCAIKLIHNSSQRQHSFGTLMVKNLDRVCEIVI
jgi:hypothetical protein